MRLNDLSDSPSGGSLPLAAPLALGVAALAVPFLLCLHITPISTFLNQWWAVWGMAGLLVMASLAGWTAGPRPVGRSTGVLVALCVVLAAAQLFTSAPWGQRWIPVGTLLLGAAGAWAAARVVRGGAVAGISEVGLQRLGTPLMGAVLVAALISVGLGLVQVFAPAWADGKLIAVPTIPGRAIGNVRQPNHLSTLLLWGAAAAVWLGVLRRWAFGWTAVLVVLLVLGNAVTASRTGMVGVLLMSLWGAFDRRLPGRIRVLLLSSVAVYGLGWWGMEEWSRHTGAFFYGDDQIKKSLHGDPTSSRGKVWRDTLTMILQHPWTGVGPGAYNFVWSMTAFPGRAISFFDHSHNLPMQLAVESGIPFALAVLGVFGWLAWRARQAARVADDAAAVSARVLNFMLLIVALHSLLEYPLWYTYFLLPTAVLLGWLTALAPDPERTPVRQSLSELAPTAAACVGAVMLVGCVWAGVQYYWVATIFEPELSVSDDPGPLAERIQRGQGSVLFGHHADYADVTMSEHPEREARDFDRPMFHLLDSRLMMAYAKAFRAVGDDRRADHVAARLREFRNPVAAEFLAPCKTQPPSQSYPCAEDPAIPAELMRPWVALPPASGPISRRVFPAPERP